jgi:nucleoside-diphosphate-sugar epimerase
LPAVEYRRADVRDLSQFDSNYKFKKIYNFAAIHTTPGHQPFEYYSTNVAGAIEVTRLAELHGIKEIVFTSSISVYGPSEEMKTEENIPNPQSDYGHSKLLAEQIHKKWLERDDTNKLTIVRPAVVFGPGEGGNFARLAKLLKKGFFIYPGRKDTIKACIYVEDLLDAISFAEAKSDSLVLFNGAYPNRYTLEQIITTLIGQHFPNARSYMVPQAVVTTAAKILGAFGFLNVGIHPERVMKLVRSTDIYPQWLTNNNFVFPEKFSDVTARWSQESAGTFI